MPLPPRPATSSITTPIASGLPINIIPNTPKQEQQDRSERQGELSTRLIDNQKRVYI
jgi:hypothetical protein